MGPQLNDAREMGVFTLLAKEAVTGFVMGFSLRLFVHALQFLGMIALRVCHWDWQWIPATQRIGLPGLQSRSFVYAYP